MGKEYPSADRFAMLSTGDLEEDRAEMDLFLLQEKRQIEAICPNGCAPMILDDPYSRHCPKCNFHGYSNTPFPPISDSG